MARTNISQNKPFNGQPNVRRGAGPVSYQWSALPFSKSGTKDSALQSRLQPTCNNVIDNIVTYVYNILPDGNHSAYVNCDYVQ